MEDWEILRAEDVIQPGTAFADLDAVKRYAAGFINKLWFKRRWPALKTLTVVDDPGGAAAFPLENGVGWIRLSEGCWHEKTFLHELAHVISPEGEGHGPIYRKNFEKLIRKVFGATAADKLLEEYKKLAPS